MQRQRTVVADGILSSKHHGGEQGSNINKRNLDEIGRAEDSFYSSIPDEVTLTFFLGAPLSVPTVSISLTTFIPSTTLPKTTCRSSNLKSRDQGDDNTKINEVERTHGVATVVMKNCDPFVFFPAFAIERMPGPVCFIIKFSSVIQIRRGVASPMTRKLYTTKFLAVDGFTTCTIVVREVSSLNHKLCREETR